MFEAHLFRRVRRADGQVLAEYAVILGVITIAVVATFVGLGGGISGAMNRYPMTSAS